MTLIVPTGFAQATYVFTSAQGTAPHITTMGHSLLDWAGTNQEAADELLDCYMDNWQLQVGSNYQLASVTLYIGDDGPSGSVSSASTARPGTRSAVDMSAAMAPVMQKVTDRLGRAGRGRMFLPGVLAEADVDVDGRIVSSRKTALDLAAATWLADLTTRNLGARLFHSATQPVFQVDQVVGLNCAPLVGWIRGRIR